MDPASHAFTSKALFHNMVNYPSVTVDVFQQNIAQGCYQFTLLLCQAEYVQN